MHNHPKFISKKAKFQQILDSIFIIIVKIIFGLVCSRDSVSWATVQTTENMKRRGGIKQRAKELWSLLWYARNVFFFLIPSMIGQYSLHCAIELCRWKMRMALVRHLAFVWGNLHFFLSCLNFQTVHPNWIPGRGFLGWIVLVESAYLSHVAYQLTLLIPSCSAST